MGNNIGDIKNPGGIKNPGNIDLVKSRPLFPSKSSESPPTPIDSPTENIHSQGGSKRGKSGENIATKFKKLSTLYNKEEGKKKKLAGMLDRAKSKQGVDKIVDSENNLDSAENYSGGGEYANFNINPPLQGLSARKTIYLKPNLGDKGSFEVS